MDGILFVLIRDFSILLGLIKFCLNILLRELGCICLVKGVVWWVLDCLERGVVLGFCLVVLFVESVFVLGFISLLFVVGELLVLFYVFFCLFLLLLLVFILKLLMGCGVEVVDLLVVVCCFVVGVVKKLVVVCFFCWVDGGWDWVWFGGEDGWLVVWLLRRKVW